jgi:hypothetical protein
MTARVRRPLRENHCRLVNNEIGPLYFGFREPNLDDHIALVERSISILRVQSPLWYERARTMCSGFMFLGGKRPIQTFHLVDRFCLLNPWYISRSASSFTDAAICLASNIVALVCIAYLTSGARPNYGPMNRSQLCCSAAYRFLKKCLSMSPTLDIPAWASAWGYYAHRRRH